MNHGPVRGFTQATNDVHKLWNGPPTWGQLLDTTHHWHKDRDPHAADLMLQTINHQLKEAQQLANDENVLQYQEWIKSGQQKGLRGLLRGFKSSELAWQRPYRQVPMPERMNHRLKEWGDVWRIRNDNQAHSRPSLQHEAQHQAQELEPIAIGQLGRVLKGLPDKASGLSNSSRQHHRSHWHHCSSCSIPWRPKQNYQPNSKCTWW